MAPWYTAIAEVVYREYDRRIRRASLITEYGADHGDRHHEHGGGEEHDEGSVIANLPRGAEISPTGANASHAPWDAGSAPPATVEDAVTAEPSEVAQAPLPTGESVALPELPPPAPSPAAHGNTPPEDDGEAEIVNVPPGR